jgi:hypothetical protein
LSNNPNNVHRISTHFQYKKKNSKWNNLVDPLLCLKQTKRKEKAFDFPIVDCTRALSAPRGGGVNRSRCWCHTMWMLVPQALHVDGVHSGPLKTGLL